MYGFLTITVAAQPRIYTVIAQYMNELSLPEYSFEHLKSSPILQPIALLSSFLFAILLSRILDKEWPPPTGLRPFFCPLFISKDSCTFTICGSFVYVNGILYIRYGIQNAIHYGRTIREVTWHDQNHLTQERIESGRRRRKRRRRNRKRQETSMVITATGIRNENSPADIAQVCSLGCTCAHHSTSISSTTVDGKL